MNQLFTFTLSVLFFGGFIASVSYANVANNANKAALALNLESFAQTLKQNHPQFRELALEVKNAELRERITNPFGYTYNSSINTASEELTNGITVTNSDGSTTNASHTLNYTQAGRYNSSLQLTHAIPLMRNKDGINALLNTDLARIDSEITELRNKQTLHTLITTEQQQLIELTYQYEKLNVLNERNTLDTKQLRLITDKYNENLVDKTDVLLQQGTLATNKLDLTSTKETITKLTNAIHTLLGIQSFTLATDLFDYSTTLPELPKMDQLLSQQINELNIQKKQRELSSLKNQEERSVNMILGAEFTGEDAGPLSAIIRPSSDFGIGLEVSFPINSDTEYLKTKSKQQEIAIIKQQMATESRNRMRSLQNLRNDLTTTLQLIEIAKEQININEQSVREYQALYENNNTEFDFVLSANTKLVNSRLRYIEYIKNYHTLMLQYQAAVL